MPILLNVLNPDAGAARPSDSVQQTIDAYRAGEQAFIGISNPTDTDLAWLNDTFGLHRLAVEHCEFGHQRAKMEKYGDIYFMVLKPTVYVDELEEIRFGVARVFVGPRFVIWLNKDSLRSEVHSQEVMEAAFARLEDEPTPMKFLHQLMDGLVDGYIPVVEGLENDGDKIEDSLFGDNYEASEISQRIYGLLNEVSDFKRAVKPVAQMLELIMGRLRTQANAGAERQQEETLELLRHYRDVHDHAVHVSERVDDLFTSLENALQVNATIVAERQNDDMKKISAWATIFVAPTIVGSIYGMNFDDMPELHWTFGYPFALGLMVAMSIGLWFTFKKKGWL
ncbi:Mg2+/Co2+ transporter [Mycobacteroides abscessus subsp. bolletii]|nr:Mg2+/Co2+ transporter [Mycobacteroides abscessus subsp. bolletii]